MKRLWKVIPPVMSDLIGFESVMNELNGYGIIDDSSHYKPISQFNRSGDHDGYGHDEHGEHGHGDHGHGDHGHGDHGHGGHAHGEHGHGGHGHGEHGHGGHGDHGHGEHGHGGHGGRDEYADSRQGLGRQEVRQAGDGRTRSRGRGDVHVINSDIRNEDIIYGTEKKVLAAGERAAELSPEFLLLTLAPSSSMIGSDSEHNAELIADSTGIPTSAVDLHGDKDYAYGIGKTLEALGRLLLTPCKTVSGTVNLLGCNPIDWTADALTALEQLLSARGLSVCSRWGVKESVENLKRGASAEYNLVLSTSGLALALYMESAFGIPYRCGAPFGKAKAEGLLASPDAEPAVPSPAELSGSAEVLVIGEQYTANAIRSALEQRGYRNIGVLSFYETDRSAMRSCDRKLTDEDTLKELAAGVKLVFAAPECRPLLDPDAKLIELPNPACISPVRSVPAFNMVGDALDSWLDGVLSDRYD